MYYIFREKYVFVDIYINTYLYFKERQHEQGRGANREIENPNVRLNSTTSGSWPEPKPKSRMLNRLSRPGSPWLAILWKAVEPCVYESPIFTLVRPTSQYLHETGHVDSAKDWVRLRCVVSAGGVRTCLKCSREAARFLRALLQICREPICQHSRGVNHTLNPNVRESQRLKARRWLCLIPPPFV